MRHPVLIALWLAAVVATHGSPANTTHEDSDQGGTTRLTLVANMTEEGKKLRHPTPADPAYYFPVTTDYKEEGAVLKFFLEPPPPMAEVQHLLAKVLAEQGYLVATRKNPPTLLLVFRWGVWAPIFFRGQFVNRDAMEGLVSGVDTEVATPINPKREEAYVAARRPRWGVKIYAFDFKDWHDQHKITPLWRVNVSTEQWGHYVSEVLPTLVAAAGPMLGRETKGTEFAWPTIYPEGHVILGTAVPKTDQAPAKTSSARP